MNKNSIPDSNDSFSDKAKRTGRKIVKIGKIILVLLLIVGVVYVLKSCGIIGNHEKQDTSDNTSVEQEYDDYDEEIDEEDDSSSLIDEDGEYTTAADVAEYIHTYHKLPSNYMSEKKAQKKGWKTNECPADYGIMIGGRPFGNYEGLLPEGEQYYECDVDYDGYLRGERRLIYTKDGIVYYTDDHYESFTQLY